MPLKTIDNRVVPFENGHNVGGLTVPDEELPVVGTTHHEVAVTNKKEERSLLLPPANNSIRLYY